MKAFLVKKLIRYTDKNKPFVIEPFQELEVKMHKSEGFLRVLPHQDKREFIYIGYIKVTNEDKLFTFPLNKEDFSVVC